LHRVISAVLGTLAAIGGIVVSGYAEMAVEDVTRYELPLWERLVGVLLVGGLMIAAFYMAFRFLRFAFTNHSD
jgi:protein-S-isoprenylcysteine O-methyltransferase Ste14